MLDKIVAPLALALLVAFVSVVLIYVAEPPLTIIVCLVLLLAAFDFWRTIRQNDADKTRDE